MPFHSLLPIHFLLYSPSSSPQFLLSSSHLPRLHDFVWHGQDPSTPGRFIPQRAKFTELEHLPSEFQCNVNDVRTNDDTLITVKLMLFYQLEDVETMASASSIG
jgi:hypothetical protein